MNKSTKVFICTKDQGIDGGAIYKNKEYEVNIHEKNNKCEIKIANKDIPMDYILLFTTVNELLKYGYFKE